MDKEMEICWLCEALFRNKTDLNRHLSSAAHRRLTVLCPWCLGKDRYFTRVGDLSDHVDKVHTEVFVPRPQLTAKNAFYIARFPMDYATITAEVTDYDHEDARKLRSAVRKWAESFENKEERMTIWLDGWKEGFGVSRKKKRGQSGSREKSVGRTVTNKGTSSSDIVVNVKGSGYSRELKENDRERSLGDSDRRKVQRLTNDKRKVENWNKHGNLDRRSRSQEGCDRDRSFSDLGRVNKEGGETRRGDKDKESKERTYTSKDTENCASKRQKTYNRTENERDRTRKEKERYSREESETERPREDLGKEKEADSSDLSQEIETGSDKRKDTDNEKETIKDKNTNQTEDIESEISDTHQTYNSVKRKNNESEGCETPAKAKRLEDELDNYIDNIELTEEEQVDQGCALDEKDRETTDSSSSSSSSSSTSSTSSDVAPTADSKSLRDRAIRILSRGAMPLCPPARRIWSRTLQIELKDEKIICWPPSNWRALSPELRLFAMEQMALTLERGSSEEFPKLPKKLLADKYMFLMLEGQEKPLAGQTEEEKVPDKIRQYNLNFLRGIVRGDISDSRQSWSILKTLEKADRWTDTDEIVDFLESKNIKIKV